MEKYSLWGHSLEEELFNNFFQHGNCCAIDDKAVEEAMWKPGLGTQGEGSQRQVILLPPPPLLIHILRPALPPRLWQTCGESGSSPGSSCVAKPGEGRQGGILLEEEVVFYSCDISATSNTNPISAPSPLSWVARLRRKNNNNTFSYIWISGNHFSA